jgi:hypothetical protein
MDDNDEPSGAAGPARAPKWTRVRGAAKWSPALGRRICARVAGGELLYVVLREAGMPTPQSVARWAREQPGFGAALDEARQAGGRPSSAGGGVSSYCQAAADAVFERLCDGESLTSICRDPRMPCQSTVYYWRRRFPAFGDALRVAREIQAERFCDLSWEMSQEATPETAYLTHVRLTHLRWIAGVMAPKAYRIKPVEPDVAPRIDVVMRRFEIEVDAETGERKVVAFCPNPVTGRVEREDDPGWTPPPGTLGLPGGWEPA